MLDVNWYSAVPIEPVHSTVPLIAVASGKGGVGKTTVAVRLALSLARAGQRVGIVDADLYGPDVPRMLGLRRDVPATGLTVLAMPGTRHARLEPVTVHGVQVASTALMLGGHQGLGAPTEVMGLLLRRLVHDTVWDSPSCIVVDLPPGTAELQQTVFALSGASVLLVVTPDEVSHLDTARLLAILRRTETPVLGGVENLGFTTCPDCGVEVDLAAAADEDRTIWSMGVRRVARLPLAVGLTAELAAGGPAGDNGFAAVTETVLRHLAGRREPE